MFTVFIFLLLCSFALFLKVLLYLVFIPNATGGSAALLRLFDELDLLDTFEVNSFSLLQKGLKDLGHRRGLEVQPNLR